MSGNRFLVVFSDRAHLKRFLTAMTFVAFLTGIGVMFIPQAWAAAFSCAGGSGNGNLFDQDTIGNQVNDASGASYTINTATAITNGDPFGTACPSNLGIFGSILCFFKVTVGQIVSNMYCSIQLNLLTPFSVAIELFIVVFGVIVMTGMIKFTPREAIMTLLKVALVWVFATNAAWGIGIGYSFFIGVAEQGSNLVLTAVGSASGSAAPGGGGYLTQPDNVLNNLFSLISTGNGGTGTFFPASLTTTCAVWIMAFLAMLLLFVPMVGGFLITMMIQYVMLYVRAFLGYLTSLVLISFLFILSPIFICFALFQVTRPMFEKWFENLLSFSLQMVIIFAFLVLLQMIPIGAFFTEMLSLLREYDTSTSTFTYPLPMTFCSICDYTIGNGNITDTPPPITCADNNAIPIGKLFLQTNLVQAVLSQIVALWIVGVVMQDFLKQAPAFASIITGGMPMLSMGGDTGGQGVQFMGLDSGWGEDGQSAIDSSDNMNSLRDRIESYRSTISTRAAPLILAGALATGYATAAGKKAAAQGTSSGSGSGAAGAGRPSSVTTTTVARPSLLSSQALAGTADAEQARVIGATEYLKKANESNAAEVQQALQTVEKYKSESGVVGNEKAYEDAMNVLQHANATWMVALSDLSQKNQQLLARRESASEVNPGTAMSGSTPSLNLADYTSKDQVQDQINLSINNLQLQIHARRAMLSNDDQGGAQALDGIQAELDKATQATSNPSIMNSAEGLTDVITQLTTVEKMLS